MEEETGEMHSEEDKALSDKNKKRTVKTRAQIQALEKFYQDQKYPSESMKADLAASIGLTEKQISGWFCHRRLKDKRESNTATQKQDRSSGVVVQDSCGSTKQIGDKQFDTKEVESLRLTPKFSGNYNVAPDGSSGSSSSLRETNENPARATGSRYPVPRFPVDQGVVARPRAGPSGYLKVKGRVENPAITAVKQQLGENYRVDGPPLSVDFDPLPPDAFESGMQDTDDDENCYTEETALPNSHNASRLRKIPEFDEGLDFNSRDQKSFRTKHGNDAPNYFVPPHHKLTNRNSSTEFNGGSDRDSPISALNREDYETSHIRDVKVSRMRYSGNPYTTTQQPIIEKKARYEQTEPSLFHNYHGEEMKGSHGYSYLAGKGTKYTGEGTKSSRGQNPPSRKIMDEANKFYPERSSTVSERRIKMKNDFNARENKWDEFPPLQPRQVSSVPRFEPEIPPQFGGEEDEEDDAETDSSAD